MDVDYNIFSFKTHGIYAVLEPPRKNSLIVPKNIQQQNFKVILHVSKLATKLEQHKTYKKRLSGKYLWYKYSDT